MYTFESILINNKNFYYSSLFIYFYKLSKLYVAISWFCNWNKWALSDKWYLNDFIIKVYDKHSEL
jgi:hypothetical protein